MKAKEREQWILDWMDSNCLVGESVDVLYSRFVWDYVEATNATHSIPMFGAPKCKQLGKDLSNLHRNGLLKRTTTGLSPGDASMGFPKWVYSYRLVKEKV